ncbi:MAG: VOC family protein [Yoonia sp.]|nr:VOC family protein [Yoonia sp.]MDG1863903.1 VOC family protein [Yoonia sp.]
MVESLDHLQLAIPKGAEDRVRPFYILLGFTEVPKPDALAGRGGFWVRSGAVDLHFGVDPQFVPATKAHPAFIIGDIDALVQRLADAGHRVAWDTKLADVRRCFVNDPVGNRIELIAA